jgi:sporulation protein YqfC
MSKFDRLFEIREEVAYSVPKLTILNFDKMLIENYKCILEYQEFFIRIKMTNGILDINGFNLELNEMTRDDVIVTGTIDSIDFEKFKEEEIKVGKK